MRFDGPGIGKIKTAIVDSFEVEELEQLALVYLNIKFGAVVGPGAFETRALKLVIHTNNRNITCDLIRAAFAERPLVPEWQELNKLCNAGPALAVQAAGVAQVAAAQLYPDALAGLAPGDTMPARPRQAVLESVVRPRLRIMNMEIWRSREASVSAQVCRIDVGGEPKGTGFLVGPNLVLTNHHVLTKLIAGEVGAADIRCVFDYKRLADGTVNQGRPVGLAAEWLVDKSPPSRGEIEGRPDDTPPTLDELDFALIRLADALGSAPVATAAAGPRGWVGLPVAQPPLPANAPMIIVQHPNSEPISMALDTSAVQGFNANRTRVRYATNTEPGSSGSPCFDFDWSLVALHHMGDPNWRNPTFNEGVPIGLIAERIMPFLPRAA